MCVQAWLRGTDTCGGTSRGGGSGGVTQACGGGTSGSGAASGAAMPTGTRGAAKGASACDRGTRGGWQRHLQRG